MKRNLLIGGVGAVVIAVIAAAVIQHSRSNNSPTTSNSHGTGPTSNAQVLPTKTNPIVNTSEQAGLSILSAMVEDNTDANNQAISDRLQVKLHNASSTSMSNIEVYYVMKDTKTGQQEAYHQRLTGLTLAANETKTIYFDNEKSAGHYPENQYSVYRSSKNQVDFTIEVSAPGFKPASGTAKKSAGTGETAG